MSFKKYLVLLAVIVFSSIGDVLLRRGMQDIGEVHLNNLVQLIHAIGNPYVLVGIAALLVFFASYSAALSWADLTYVLPATAVSYVVLALISLVFLHEVISVQRWVGIGLIVIGVSFVAGGPAVTAGKPGSAQEAALPADMPEAK